MLNKIIKDTIARQRVVMSQTRCFADSNPDRDNEYRKVLRLNAISANIKECQYAVRGAIPIMGEKIKKRIKEGDRSFPFDKVTPLNIGNPQAVGQGFI